MCQICELVPFLLDEAGSKGIPKELPLHSLGFICYKYLALCTAQQVQALNGLMAVSTMNRGY